MNRIQSNLVYRYGKVRAAISKEQGFQISLLPKQKALWYRVPKAGTRSINHHFNNHVDGYYYCSKDVLLNPFYQDWFKFVIIRNPLERARSVWRQKILGGLGAELFGLKESETEKLQDFDEFVRWLGDQNLDSGEVHIRKQTALIPAEEMDFIGTLETLEEDFGATCSRLNLEHSKLPHKNKTERLESTLAPQTHNLIMSYYQEDSVLWENLYGKREHMKSP